VTARLIAIRHGQSTSNVRRIATSRLDGYPLTDVGRAQAAEVGERLVGRDVEHVYASRIQRARETAGIIADSIAAPLTLLAGLEEVDVGIHEGRSEGAVQTNALANFERWLSRGDLDHGFEGGETALQAMARTSSVLIDIVRRHPDGTVVVVSHGGVLALALINLCRNVTPGFVFGHLLDNCAVVEVDADADGDGDGAANAHHGRPGWACVDWAGVMPLRRPGNQRPLTA